MQKNKLIIDTDIGTDVDDAYALLFALASPDIDLKLITLVHANLEMRALLTAKLLKLAGREDVPVAKGISETLCSNRATVWGGFEGVGIDFSDVGNFPVGDDAVGAMIETVGRYPGEVTICPIGPLTNIAVAIERHPDVMRKVKRLSIMGSSFLAAGRENAQLEHNIRCDPEAAEVVLNSGIPIRLVGLNVTLQVPLYKNDMEPLRGVSPLADYLLYMTDQWFGIRGSDQTAMHDPLAVAAVVAPHLVKTEQYSAHVVTDGADEGKTVFDKAEPGQPAVDVCTDVDAQAFRELFLSRIHTYIKENQ